MRQAKLITLSTVVGLSLMSYANAAQAATTTLSGTVTSSCTVTASAAGTLGEDDTPAVQLDSNNTFSGGSHAGVNVICNNSTNKLGLSVNTAQSVLNGGTAKIQFIGNGGVFGTTNPSC